jgi:ABC-2 type transport system ATP-binding protein
VFHAPTSDPVVVEDLAKRYGAVTAIAGLSFRVRPNEVFGFLGPNGAGKTTTIEILEGLRTADSGRVSILGTEIAGRRHTIKDRIGVQLQATSFFPRLSAAETLRLFGSFFQRAVEPRQALAWVNLEEHASARTAHLSGGQRQRLAIAVALVNDPDLVFLDEPTVGLDPHSRRHLWDIVSSLKARGKTVFLTTHYMEEAERLCDRVAVIQDGRIIAEGGPEELIRRSFPHAAIELASPSAAAETLLCGLPFVAAVQSRNGRSTLYSSDPQQTLLALARLSVDQGLDLQDLTLRRATLDDVFLKLTGRPFGDSPVSS